MPTVEVELLFLSSTDGAVAYRATRLGVPDCSDPDRVARCAAGDAAQLVHSTSWRHELPATVVLTYVATPDPRAAEATPLDTTLVLSSGDALRPQPPHLHEHHVAAHAVRHVSELAVTDPALAPVVAQDPALWADLARFAARTRTGTHDSHESASRSA